MCEGTKLGDFLFSYTPQGNVKLERVTIERTVAEMERLLRFLLRRLGVENPQQHDSVDKRFSLLGR